MKKLTLLDRCNRNMSYISSIIKFFKNDIYIFVKLKNIIPPYYNIKNREYDYYLYSDFYDCNNVLQNGSINEFRLTFLNLFENIKHQPYEMDDCSIDRMESKHLNSKNVFLLSINKDKKLHSSDREIYIDFKVHVFQQ